MNATSSTHDPNPPAESAGTKPALPPPDSHPSLVRLPGVVAIGIYLLLLAGIIVFYVVTGRAQPFYLVFPVFFIAAAAGLMLLLRWAWALALATMALMSAIFVYEFFAQHQLPSLVQALLNLVFFLYLVRADVREKLK